MDGNTIDEIDNKEELRREGNIRREIHKKEESLWICQWTRSAEAKYLAIVAAADATGFLIYKLGGFRNILETFRVCARYLTDIIYSDRITVLFFH